MPLTSPRIPTWSVPLVLAVLLLLAPVSNLAPSWQIQIILVAVLALVTSGFNLGFGYTGELSLGQVALYAVGAYTGAILQVHGYDLSLALIAAGAAAALVGLAIGVPGLRLGGWGLAMVSFLLIVMLPDLADLWESETGGMNGLVGIPTPKLFGSDLTPHGFYMVVIAVTAAWFAVMRNIVASRHGGALRVLRQSPVLAASLGMNVARTKLVTYAIGAIPAGLGGCLLASQQLFLAPDIFNFDLVIAVIAASVLGGSESVYGAIIGAAILQLGPMRATVFGHYALVAYGAFLVICGVFFRGGIAQLTRNLRARYAARSPRVTAVPPEAQAVRLESAETAEATEAVEAQPGKVLRIDAVTKRFGGATALDDVSFEARPGRVTGLIGANGSGKTTLLNLICGFYVPTAGTLTLGEQQIQGRRPYWIARQGVARTFQTPLIPTAMPVRDVVATARYIGDYSAIPAAVLRLPSFRRALRRDREHAARALRVLGIEHLADVPAASLSLGNRRLVEVARVLAASPSLVLLDEPASGLDEREVRDLELAIRRLRASGTTVILVEHNFQLICDVSDDIHVLELGRMIASGDADAIRADPAVARSYLGDLDSSLQETALQETRGATE